MNNQDIIRKAVELADGWHVAGEEKVTYWDGGTRHINYGPLPRLWLDGIAAQLVRQVDALPDFSVESLWDRTYVMKWPDVTWQKPNVLVREKGSDRTMNTLKAIVESKVLENESND